MTHPLSTSPRMSERLILTVPMPPTLTNSAKGRSRHWRAVEREKLAYWELLDLWWYAKKIPSAPRPPLDRVTVRSIMYLGGGMDDDNAVARHKWVLDWLVWRMYLVSDRRKHLRWEAFPDQIVKRDQEYRITLTLTPISTHPEEAHDQ